MNMLEALLLNPLLHYLVKELYLKRMLLNIIRVCLKGKLEREFSQVWNELIYDSCDAGPSELYEHIKKAYRR